MANKRLIDCNFMKDMIDVSNKAKLLYFTFFVNADDKGFVGNAKDIIATLQRKSDEKNEVNLELLDNDFVSALHELVESGLFYEFKSNHGNRVYLIRHWYYHNKMTKGLWTNYGKYLARVVVKDNEYILVNTNNNPKIKYGTDNELTYPNLTYHNINNNNADAHEQDKADWEENWDKMVEEMNDSSDSKGD